MKKRIHHITIIRRLYTLFFITFLTVSYNLSAQSQIIQEDRCFSHLILQERYQNRYEEQERFFESWLNDKKVKSLSSRNAVQVDIPVVFHVMHNGEEVGNGGNLSRERIDRQLQTLNEDFNQLNPDRVNTLAEFTNSAANIQINFVYAKQDPTGYPFDGITRQIANQNNYAYEERETLASEIMWPADDYLNIWIINVAGNGLGWAEFPESNLDGIDNGNIRPNADGVAIDYQYIGDNPDSPIFDSKGRTLTHEMGHFLGLRHIWGDGGCNADDYCSDTPSASESSYGCDLEKSTCESLDMVQNFMDYSNDDCMTLFTEDQKLRMRTVLDNSPRRLSLLSSEALQDPPEIKYDIGLISDKSSVYRSSCKDSYLPSAKVKNFGTKTIYSYSLKVFQNNNLIESVLIEDSLQSGEEKIISFAELQFRQAIVSNDVKYQLLLNDTMDERGDNNEYSEIVQLLQKASSPYSIDFKSSFADWFIRNPDQETSWMQVKEGLYMSTFNNRSNRGQKDAIVSPIYDFSELKVPELTLTVSQSYLPEQNKFTIYASTDCGETFSDIVYSDYGNSISSAYLVDEAFVPEHNLDWNILKIDLTKYRNIPSICFKLEIENRGGNNFYLADFAINNSKRSDKEITPISWSILKSVNCNNTISGELILKNTGRSAITQFKLSILEDNDTLLSEPFNQVLFENETLSLQLDQLTTKYDKGNLKVISEVYSDTDSAFISKEYLMPYANTCIEETPPLRLNLNAQKNNFINLSASTQNEWSFDNGEMTIKTNPVLNGDATENWLVSPLINTENIDYLSLIFDVAYHKPFKPQEALYIYAYSPERPEAFPLIYYKAGDSLATSFGNQEDYNSIFRNELVDLGPFLRYKQIRIAFKAVHEGGAPIKLKDISLFLGQETPPDFPNTQKPFVVYPNPVFDGYLNLHFNLPEAESGEFFITDLRGRQIMNFNQPKILNQFVTFDIASLATGIYLLHFKSEKYKESIRFLVK